MIAKNFLLVLGTAGLATAAPAASDVVVTV
jgi:hypothetical protein